MFVDATTGLASAGRNTSRYEIRHADRAETNSHTFFAPRVSETGTKSRACIRCSCPPPTRSNGNKIGCCARPGACARRRGECLDSNPRTLALLASSASAVYESTFMPQDDSPYAGSDSYDTKDLTDHAGAADCGTAVIVEDATKRYENRVQLAIRFPDWRDGTRVSADFGDGITALEVRAPAPELNFKATAPQFSFITSGHLTLHLRSPIRLAGTSPRRLISSLRAATASRSLPSPLAPLHTTSLSVAHSRAFGMVARR